MGQCMFWISVPPPLRRRPPPSRHVPLVHPAAGGDVWRNGPVRVPSRPRSVSVMGCTAPGRPLARLTRRLGRVSRPGTRPRAAGRAQPRAGGWGSKAESETRSKCEAQANANSSGISVASSDLNGRASDVGPYSLFRRFCRAAILRVWGGSWAGPPISAAAHPGRQCDSDCVRSVPHPAS